MKRTELSRRRFVGGLAAAGVFSIVPRHVLGKDQTPPSEKLNVACIGCGGMGDNDVRNMESQNIVALCDVDARRAAPAFKRHSKTPKFKDFRRMLDKMDKQIDAVTVTTPDHMHFPAAMHAIRMRLTAMQTVCPMRVRSQTVTQRTATKTASPIRAISLTARSMTTTATVSRMSVRLRFLRFNCRRFVRISRVPTMTSTSRFTAMEARHSIVSGMS